MSRWHTDLAGRFNTFPKSQQLLMAANELNRANNLIRNPREYKNALERALELVDLCSTDPRWHSALRELRRSREVIAWHYQAETPEPLDVLIRVFIQLDQEAWKMLNPPTGVKS
jgi:hypothetical protein